MMEVVVETIVSDRHFEVIFSAMVLTEAHSDHGRRVRIRVAKTDIGRVPVPGERWLVSGEVGNTEYGSPQVEAMAARPLLPTGRFVRDFLASHAPGIGQERAARLWSAFGDTLADVLSDEGAVHRIAEVVAPDRPMLAVRLAAAAVSSWRDARSEAAALAWFDGHGVTDLVAARRAIRILGDDTVERLTANAYVLVPLLPWPVVDGIGLRVASGYPSPSEDVRRRVGAADEAVIPAAAAAVRGKRMPEFVEDAGVGDGVSFVEAAGDALAGEVPRVAVELGILEGSAVVVTATNDGDAGVNALNASLHERHVESTGAFPMRGLLGRFFSVGSPVIFGRNDYRLGLFNGLMGKVVRTFPDGMAVSVHFDGEAEPRLLVAEHLVGLYLTYAVTCHKCQGSSAPRVVVPVYPSRVVDPSWLYTAITRGERQVVFVGDPEHFADALAKKFSADLRQVGLRWSWEAA